MDAKTRDLALLTALSFFCAGVTWILDPCFGFRLFCARWCSRRSRNSLGGALTCPMGKIVRGVKIAHEPHLTRAAHNPDRPFRQASRIAVAIFGKLND